MHVLVKWFSITAKPLPCDLPDSVSKTQILSTFKYNAFKASPTSENFNRALTICFHHLRNTQICRSIWKPFARPMSPEPNVYSEIQKSGPWFSFVYYYYFVASVLLFFFCASTYLWFTLYLCSIKIIFIPQLNREYLRIWLGFFFCLFVFRLSYFILYCAYLCINLCDCIASLQSSIIVANGAMGWCAGVWAPGANIG